MIRVVFAMLALLIGQPAHAQWRTATTDHFVVYSDRSVDKTTDFAQSLERYDALLRLVSGVSRPLPTKSARVTVYLIPSEALFRRLTGNSSSIAGFYIARAEDPSAFVPVADSDSRGISSQTILLHEYAHHFMFLNLPAAYPGWFVEGFAEFNGSTRMDKDGTIYIGGPAMHRSFGLTRGAFSPSSIVSGARPKTDIDADEYYAKSWAIVHYLTFSPDRKGQLNGYLDAVTRGASYTQAAQNAFGDLRQFDREITSYTRQRTLPAIKLGLSTIPSAKVNVRDLGPGPSAIMASRIISRRGVDKAQATALIPEFRRAAAPYPGDVFVQSALAEAEFDARNYAEADAAATRAIAADPKAIDAMLYRGRVAAARAEEEKITDEARWKAVRALFVAANRIDPSNPGPLLENYASYGKQGIAPSANAVIGLAEAQRLAPQDTGTRHMLIVQYLGDDRLEEARRLLQPFVGGTHGQTANRYAAAMTAIDAKDGRTALKALAQTDPQKDADAPK